MEIITFALLAVLIGMRHGMDGDHIAAIADMVGTESKKKRQVSLGVMYACGHGIIVLIIGLITIFLGSKLPESTLSVLEVCVSLTLIILGGVILLSIFKRKKDYEFKSRITILSEMILKTVNKTGDKNVKLSPVGLAIIGAFIVGIIHGIGVETPTQIAVISNAVGLDNITVAAIQLILFVIGLLVSTILITFLLSWGFMKAKVKQNLYLIFGSITGLYSVGLGLLMLIELL
ncbi:high-affinity nickel-transport protein [Thalassobacillus cyri]|uniref:Nickel/cobalt efflux system n=1 Tax=Thalassobacillus cyri TaxID=571932 RepID=A0A1H4GWH9_9BACI|nr:High-affinity nickel-transporter [Thalassobacillus cyri]SEB13651.1 high-affinity nickel-transport protein [Thalassobacillus cyri]